MPTHLPWPRNGHTEVLVDEYKHRRPSLVGWARAGFVQGALSPLLSLPGLVEVRVLPGDKMFQATETKDGYSRPVILHGYSGAEKLIPKENFLCWPMMVGQLRMLPSSDRTSLHLDGAKEPSHQ